MTPIMPFLFIQRIRILPGHRVGFANCLAGLREAIEQRKRAKIRKEYAATHMPMITMYWERGGAEGIPAWLKEEWEFERMALYGDAISGTCQKVNEVKLLGVGA